jgi:hypothetical protein
MSQAARQKEKYRSLNPPWEELGFITPPTATVGAVNELRVSADLLLKGYNVFRALSPSCPCDLLILKNGSTLRVEVTTANYAASGRIIHNKQGDTHKFDVLAIVKRQGEIIYVPELPPV